MKWLSSAPWPAAGTTIERARAKGVLLFYAQIAHKEGKANAAGFRWLVKSTV